MNAETYYLLPPSDFLSMRETRKMANTFRRNLATRHQGADSTNGTAVATFSELVNDDEHGMSTHGARCHVRVTPHCLGRCLRHRGRQLRARHPA